MDPIIPQSQEQLYSPISEQKHFMNKKFIVTFVVLALLGSFASVGIWWWGNQQQPDVYTFEECTNAKDSKMLETYPEQCVTKDGQTFVNPDQKVDPTVNWQTYRNDEYGFEFEYPEDWKLVSYNMDHAVEVAPKDGLGHNIYFFAEGTDKSFKSIEERIKIDELIIRSDSPRSEIMVGGEKGLDIQPSPGDHYIYLLHGGKVYHLHIFRPDFILEVGKILSSFKFIP